MFSIWRRIFQKSLALLKLIKGYNYSIFISLSKIAGRTIDRVHLARKILAGIGKQEYLEDDSNREEQLISEKIQALEENGLIKISGGIIHYSKDKRLPSEHLEKSVIKSIREIDEIELEEKTDFYLTRLRDSKGVFAWQNKLFDWLKIRVENFIFFWKFKAIHKYSTTSRLAEKLFEWETKLVFKSIPPEIELLLRNTVKKVNEIKSETILKKASFGKANVKTLGNQPVFIISDLHLASGAKLDRFNKAAKLIRLLKVVQKLNAVLIINGDFFDFWQTNPRKVFTKYKEIIWELVRIKRVILIPGNHDAWLSHFNNQRFLMPNISVINSFYDPDNNLYIEHGHLGDPINRSFFGRVFAAVVLGAEKISRIKMAEGVENLMKSLTPEKLWYEHQVESYVQRMRQIYFDELKIKHENKYFHQLRIVFGHIHYVNYLKTIELIQKECEENLPEVNFFSSGHWTDVNPIFLVFLDGKFSTIRLAGGTDDFINQLRSKV